jgi:tRNA 2-selenouridine synthase
VLKQQRIEAWLSFVKQNPKGVLYCFRGGLRSKITQQWIFEHSGVEYPRIKGGYKAVRQFLISETQRIMNHIRPLVIGGQTGCGKTLLLNEFTQKIDLEGLANHRGSAFGNTTTSQPTQINFENTLAIALLKQQNAECVLFEDEGRNIGINQIPECVKNKTEQADLILLNATIQTRLEISINAYVIDIKQSFLEKNPENGFEDFSNYWLNSLNKIQKRLGLERYKVLQKKLVFALDKYQKTNEHEGFYPIIETLLLDYYDPMYDYQIKKKQNRVVFSGNLAEVREYLLSSIN